MHDDQGSASALEQSEATTTYQRGERSVAEDLLPSLPPQSDSGEVHSKFPGLLEPNLDMSGRGDHPLGNIIITDQTSERSPTTRLDIRPADECSTRNEGSASSPLDESRGREAWIVLGAVTAALVVGFFGGLASYR